MLENLIPQLRLQVAKAHKMLAEDMAASVEKVYNDILLMRNFTMNEFKRIQNDANLSENDKNIAPARRSCNLFFRVLPWIPWQIIF